ncbi:hypothetical protein [Nocardiopsis baichengensis]|uniref:hypothetical protein n=1 Tax=Nocardiopsis baichengensis TaxID=280240 RepID=UPI00034B6BFD|nr:hypothetical protein [Nocardiopsis baichengensis]
MTVTVPQVVADKVENVAAEQGVSVSSYICQAMIDRMAADTADVLAEYGAPGGGGTRGRPTPSMSATSTGSTAAAGARSSSSPAERWNTGPPPLLR